MSAISVCFEEGERLRGQGEIAVEKGRLCAEGEHTIQEADVLYLNLDWGVLGDLRLQRGSYVICRGGLYRRVLP